MSRLCIPPCSMVGSKLPDATYAAARGPLVGVEHHVVGVEVDNLRTALVDRRGPVVSFASLGAGNEAEDTRIVGHLSGCGEERVGVGEGPAVVERALGEDGRGIEGRSARGGEAREDLDRCDHVPFGTRVVDGLYGSRLVGIAPKVVVAVGEYLLVVRAAQAVPVEHVVVGAREEHLGVLDCLEQRCGIRFGRRRISNHGLVVGVDEYDGAVDDAASAGESHVGVLSAPLVFETVVRGEASRRLLPCAEVAVHDGELLALEVGAGDIRHSVGGPDVPAPEDGAPFAREGLRDGFAVRYGDDGIAVDGSRGGEEHLALLRQLDAGDDATRLRAGLPDYQDILGFNLDGGIKTRGCLAVAHDRGIEEVCGVGLRHDVAVGVGAVGVQVDGIHHRGGYRHADFAIGAQTGGRQGDDGDFALLLGEGVLLDRSGNLDFILLEGNLPAVGLADLGVDGARHGVVDGDGLSVGELERTLGTEREAQLLGCGQPDDGAVQQLDDQHSLLEADILEEACAVLARCGDSGLFPGVASVGRDFPGARLGVDAYLGSHRCGRNPVPFLVGQEYDGAFGILVGPPEVAIRLDDDDGRGPFTRRTLVDGDRRSVGEGDGPAVVGLHGRIHRDLLLVEFLEDGLERVDFLLHRLFQPVEPLGESIDGVPELGVVVGACRQRQHEHCRRQAAQQILWGELFHKHRYILRWVSLYKINILFAKNR